MVSFVISPGPRSSSKVGPQTCVEPTRSQKRTWSRRRRDSARIHPRDVTVRLRDFGGGRLEQNLAAETHGAAREIAIIRAGLRGKSVHERTSLRVEILPRLL